MSLVGTTIRNGLRTAAGIEYETVRILSEYTEEGKRYYKCRVMRNQQGSHRTILADVADQLYTPATKLKPNFGRAYKGENPSREIRAR